MATEEEPPFNAGDVQAGIEGLARAVAWLTGTIKEERTARRALQAQVTEVAARTTLPDPQPQAPAPPLTPMAATVAPIAPLAIAVDPVVEEEIPPKTSAEIKEISKNRDSIAGNRDLIQGNAASIENNRSEIEALRNGQRELQAFVRYLEENFGNQRKQQEQRQVVAEQSLGRKVDDLRTQLAEELAAVHENIAEKVEQAEKVADQVKKASEEVRAAANKDEPRAAYKRRATLKSLEALEDTADFGNRIDALGTRLDAACKALTERLDLVDERVNGIGRPALSPPAAVEQLARDLDFGADEEDVSEGPGPTAPIVESAASPDPKPIHVEPAEVAEPSPQAPVSSPVPDESPALAMLDKVKAETAQALQNLQKRLTGVEAECTKLANNIERVEAVAANAVQEQLNRPRARTESSEEVERVVGEASEALTDEQAPETQAPETQQPETQQPETQHPETQQVEAQPVARSAASKRVSRAKTEGPGSLLIQRRSVSSAERHRSSSSDRAKLQTPTGSMELRTELIGYMETQMQEFRDQTKEGTQDAVATATLKLREELTGWLSDKMQSVPAVVTAGSTDPPGSAQSSAAADRGQAPRSRSRQSAVGSRQVEVEKRATIAGDNMGPLEAKMVEDAVSTAASELRVEIGAWLEEQLAAIRAVAEGSRPVSAPSPTLSPAAGSQMAPSGPVSTEGRVDGQAAATSATAKSPAAVGGESIAEAAMSAADSDEAVLKRRRSKLAALGEGTVAEAAQQIRAEIGDWLEVQLDKIHAASAGVPAPSSRGSRQGSQVGNLSSLAAFPERRESDGSSAGRAPVVNHEGLVFNNLEDVVKWFESQMNELGSAMHKSRKDAVTRASNSIREEVKQWWEHELLDIHRQSRQKKLVSPKRHLERDAGGKLPPSPRATASDSGRAKPLQEELDIDSLIDAVSKDEALVSNVLKRVRTELLDEQEDTANQERPVAAEDDQSEDAASPRSGGKRRSLIGGSLLKLSPGALRDLDERVSRLEHSLGKPAKAIGPVPELPVEAAKAANSLETPADFNSMLEVHDAIRRLTTRFEYLESRLPPDVQKALQFFEPLTSAAEASTTNDATYQTSPRSGASQMVTSSAIMRRIHELQAGQANVTDEAKSMSEDARREVVNLSRALRGTQRESEVNASKLEDLQRGLASLKSRLEAALPQVVRLAEGMHRADAPLESSADGESISPNPLQGLRVLLEEQAEVDAPHPFVSQSGLRQALDALQGDVQAWLNRLREDLLAALQGKADADLFRSAIEDLTRQVQSPVTILSPPEAATEGSAAIRWPVAQGRCLTCDTKVELRIDDPRAWQSKIRSVPSPAFPQRFPHVPPSLAPPPNMRPVMPASSGPSGTSMKRVESLPAINR